VIEERADHFAGALESVEQLRELYEPPGDTAVNKELQEIDDVCRRLIAVSPMALLSTSSPDGRCDVTPRGGQPGFVTVLDDHHVGLPDATGNRRLDSLRNIVANGHAGLLFLIPGRTQTLRLNGRACVTTRPDVLERLTPVGKPPRTAIVIRADEVYTHCPKAFIRSKLWQPESWPEEGSYPTTAEAAFAHVRRRIPSLTLEEVEQSQADAIRYRLL
jgi:PPOX class probable FMN-dependent enzyme